MALITSNWVGYLDRSYQQIKQSVINRLVDNNPEITDHSESNILIIIIDLFAGITEMINYYIDNMSREAFIESASRFSSMAKLVKMLDYRIKARFPESVDISFVVTNGQGAETNLSAPLTIPRNTPVKTSNSIIFYTSADLVIPQGKSRGNIPSSQTTFKVGVQIGLTNGLANQVIPIGYDYQEASMSLIIDNQAYTLVRSFGLTRSTDPVFIIEIDVNGLANIILGDGVNGIIPPSDRYVFASYQTTLGPAGKVNELNINALVNTIIVPGGLKLSVYNLLKSSGGSLYENVSAIKKNAPLSIRTLERAVTRGDYKDVAVMAPGVAKADVHFCCGKKVDLYIAPQGGGIASNFLLDNTGLFMDDKKMITTKINMAAAGETPIFLVISGKPKFRLNPDETEADIMKALADYADTLDINSSVRLSDVYALIDNLVKVDYLNLDTFSTLPYARPIGHTLQLPWFQREVLPGSTARLKWKLEWSGSNFRVFKDSTYLGIYNVGTQFVDAGNVFRFVINSGPFIQGMIWEFITYPINQDLVIDDYTVPIIDPNFVTLNILPQNSLLRTNANC